MKNKEVVLIAPLPAISKRTRLAKMVPVILAEGYKVAFFGWEREEGELEYLRSVDINVTEKTILRGGGYAKSQARLMYPLWMLLVFFRVLFLKRNSVLFCLGWETAFPARLAAFFSGAKVIFDDADRFSMIIRLPNFAQKILVALERWTSRTVTLHVIPSFSRYEWAHSRMWELRNSPMLADMESAQHNPPVRSAAELVVYANGWIGESRGAPIFLRALDLIAERGLDIQMVIAGRVTGAGAERLTQHPKVKFLGEVSQSEALSWYSAVDVLLTYYDPAVSINRKAESNKWGDAVFFKTPFIVNSEVETADLFVKRGAAWAVPYQDVAALVDLLELLLKNRAMIDEAARLAAQFRSEYPLFDERVREILKAAFSEVQGD